MTYNLFISHSWTYANQYEGLVSLLNQAENFNYKNYSVPKDDPIHHASNTEELKNAIRRQMQYANCVVVLAGVYASYSKWINIELELAQEMNKKIIAVEYWGTERTSQVVKNVADKVVGWNTNSIVDAIKS